MDNYVEIAVPRIDVDYVKKLMKTTPNFNVSEIFIDKSGYCEEEMTLAVYAVKKKDEQLLDFLINASADLNGHQLDHYRTPLIIAVSENNLKLVKKLHAAGADVNRRWARTSETPLGEAVIRGYFEITQYLVDNGANVNDFILNYPKLGHTSVLIAANKGYNDIVEMLLKNNAEPFGKIQLSNLNVDGVKEILRTTPNININSIFICKECRGYGPLPLAHLAVVFKNEDLLDYLMKSNANLNIWISEYGTALNIAAANNDLKLVKKIINLNANFNAQQTVSALIFAALKDSLEVGQYLIDMGVDVNAKIIDGYKFIGLNALHAAICRRNKDFVELLLKNNADINNKSEDGWTPITFACSNEDLELMKILVVEGAIVDSHVFIQAAESTNPEIIEYLLTLDIDAIDIHFTNKNLEDPPLHQLFNDTKRYSFAVGISDSIQVIIDAGFNINTVNHNNELIVEIVNDPELSDMIKHHIIKLKQAGIYTCQRNIKVVEQGYDNFHAECHQEIIKLKSDKIGSSNFTYYKVLHKHFHLLAIRLMNTNISDILNENKLCSEYPLYGSIIFYKLAKVNRRIALLESVEEFLDYALNYCLKLPYTFTRELYFYLTNEDLQKLM